MKLVGNETIHAPREAVWKGLNDPQILKACIPGCEEIIQSSPTELKAKVVVKLGPVKAPFRGAVTLSDLKPPESYRISGKGEGGLAGFASGGADVKLTAVSADETLLEYNVDAQIGGKMAMLGARLIDSTAQSYATQFFTKFASLIKVDAASPKGAVAKKSAPKKKAKK